MDLRPTDEQAHLVETFATLYARESTSERVRAVEPLGFDKALWEQLLGIGVLAMAVPERAGGWGASLLDLALIAEEQGRALASAPLIECQVAARLLAALGSDRLDDAVHGARMVTLALHAPVDGLARMVPAGAVADDAIVRRGDELMLFPLEDGRIPVDNLGSMPLADVPLEGGHVLASGAAASAAYEAALDEYATLTSTALVGMAARSVELAVEYAKHRHAWGQPIGSFQGIAHRLADAATAVDGARLLSYEAAWAHHALASRFAELASMAFGFASSTAADATYWGVHVHGGYGFMLEYDVQLYHRRARGWARVLSSPRDAYERVGARRYAR